MLSKKIVTVNDSQYSVSKYLIKAGSNFKVITRGPSWCPPHFPGSTYSPRVFCVPYRLVMNWDIRNQTDYDAFDQEHKILKNYDKYQTKYHDVQKLFVVVIRFMWFKVFFESKERIHKSQCQVLNTAGVRSFYALKPCCNITDIANSHEQLGYWFVKHVHGKNLLNVMKTG